MDVKICGLSTRRTLCAALDGGATHVGFVFFPKSPRCVSIEDAAALRAAARGRARAVAVVVDPDDEQLDAIVEGVKPDVIQLHGQETPERVARAKERCGLPAMKALGIASRSDLSSIDEYRGVADSFLLDAKPPAGAELPGGNGIAFDWSILRSLDPSVRYMLSGGLSADGLDELVKAIALDDLPGIDLSSGLESSPGVKEPEMIEAFFSRLRSLPRSAKEDSAAEAVEREARAE